MKKLIPETKIHKILETNSSFDVKQGTRGKIQVLFLVSFLLVLIKPSFCQRDLALGYHSMKFREFGDIPQFPKILVLKSFRNS